MSIIKTDEQVAMLTLKEAELLDEEIVGGASKLQYRLLEMYNGEGWKVLGYKNWGDYLGSVSDRAGIGTKALRRWHKSAMLVDGAGMDVGDIKEGTVRAIIDTLSDRKGFTSIDREGALELAIEFAGGDTDNLTGNIAQNAAWYVAVTKTAPDAGSAIVDRLRQGEITPHDAHLINYIMLDDEATGMEHILSELSDPDLARYLVNLRQHSKAAYEELEETLVATGHLPTRTDEQIPVARATYSDVVAYLDEPGRLRRHEKAIERTQAYKEVATLAAKLAIDYWGIHREVPDTLRGREVESKMYQLLLDLGFIKYGVG